MNRAKLVSRADQPRVPVPGDAGSSLLRAGLAARLAVAAALTAALWAAVFWAIG